ncbi:hypothetical protein HUJ04_001767 [Dendroctonus ponderosae]|uniref:Transforming acidic coiled-coil-containing protein C-terminal domain-containing protein n=1 Tax=Dendroctonus ponderosae TaxID=77166 RepID=A0AAR5Q0N3_DENPD|nr:hypothetical protein HUJ04_001740 [Dendroctonus ponderosae]KAH1009408.1 hypothetical protein HUJ04_001767 [Dendroctonus ponderosae]
MSFTCSTTGQIIDTKPTEEDETFQDAVTGSDSIINTGETRKNEQTFLASTQISCQSSTQPSVNQSFTAKTPQTPPSREKQIIKMQDSETEISQQELKIQQRDSITFNITEADSLNTSMVDSLEAPNADGLLPNHELSDSLEVLEFESSRESSTEPVTFNAEDSNDYVSLSYILDDSIENSSSGNTILESSLNVKRSPLEMSGISLPKRNHSEELTTSKSEGALENLIRTVNETLVLAENAHQTNIEDPKQFNIVENLDELEPKNALENTEENETVHGLEPKENIPIKSDTLLKNDAEQNSVESEIKTAFEDSKTLTKEASESEPKPFTKDIKNRNDSDECPNATNINVDDADMHKSLEGVRVVDPKCLHQPGSWESSTNVEKAKPKEKTPEQEDAVLSLEEKRETVEAETPDQMSKEEQIRIYERQETQELDHIIKKLEETTVTKSAANEENRVSLDRQDTQEFEKLERNFEENHVSFHRQDTQEFENLERKFEGIAKSNSSNTTDDILDILVARSQNSHDKNGKPSDELHRSDKPEIVDLNNQLAEVNKNHEKAKVNIEYQRQDTKEFENFERQYANDVLDQLVSENNEDISANKELTKTSESSHRSDFLLSMIESTNIDTPSEEFNQNKSNEAVAIEEDNLHFSVENCCQIQSIANQNAESIKEGGDENEVEINQEAKSSLNDQIREAKPRAEEREVVEASQNVEQSETETAAKNETIQSSKSGLEAQNKNATTDTEQSAKTEENIAEVNGRDETAYGLKTATYKKSVNRKNAQRKKAAKKHFANSSAPDSNAAQHINGRVGNQNNLEEKLDAELKLPGLESTEDKRNGNKNEALNGNGNSTENKKLVSTQNQSAANNQTKNGIDFEQDSIKPANNKTTLKIEHSSSTINNYKKLLEQYEKRILEQSIELEKLKTELSTNFRHFNNTEMAFSDLFEKYEKAKSVITLYKQNEDILVENIENAEGQLSQLESKCAAMKRQCLEQIRRAQQETEDEKQRYRRDLSNLQAQVKRLEIKAASLEIELSQKTEECQALANLCDEITGRQ